MFTPYFMGDMGDPADKSQWDFLFDPFANEDTHAPTLTWSDEEANIAAEWNPVPLANGYPNGLPDSWATLRAYSEIEAMDAGMSVSPSDLEGRPYGYPSFGSAYVPESDDEQDPVRDQGEVYGNLEDHEDRPIQLLEQGGDVANPCRSPVSPDSGFASTSGTEAANTLSLTSTSVGGDHSAGGTRLNNASHDSVDTESRDKITKNHSAAKGEQVARPRKPARETSKATEGGTTKGFQKDSKGYVNPIEILRHLHRAGGGFKTPSFDDLFPEDQAVKVDPNGKYKCGIQGWVPAEGVAQWIETNSEPCDRTLASQDLYRRHVLAVHFGVPRLQKHSQRERLLKRIEEHDQAESRGRKRKADDDGDYDDGEQRAKKRPKMRASSSEM